MDLDLDGLAGVAGDGRVDLGVAAADDSSHAAAGRRPHDPRQVHVAPQGRTGDEDLPGLLQGGGRLVAKLDEVFGHGNEARGKGDRHRRATVPFRAEKNGARKRNSGARIHRSRSWPLCSAKTLRYLVGTRLLARPRAGRGDHLEIRPLQRQQSWETTRRRERWLNTVIYSNLAADSWEERFPKAEGGRGKEDEGRVFFLPPPPSALRLRLPSPFRPPPSALLFALPRRLQDLGDLFAVERLGQFAAA